MFFTLLRAEQPKQKSYNYQITGEPGGASLLGLAAIRGLRDRRHIGTGTVLMRRLGSKSSAKWAEKSEGKE